jgi:ABC-type transport system involved in cytochrome bd biosynthesis fused ATPase/permease subunit
LNDALILSLREDAGLGHLIDSSQKNESLHQVGNCKDLLSLDKKQRLVFCRILYHRPKLVFLDESTSYVDAQSALYFYQLSAIVALAILLFRIRNFHFKSMTFIYIWMDMRIGRSLRALIKLSTILITAF